MSTAVPRRSHAPAPRAWRAYGVLTGLFAAGAAATAMLLP
jgi:hypothetical protein